MPVSSWSTTAASNVAVGGVSIAEECNPGNLNDASRAIMAEAKARFNEVLSVTDYGADVTGVADSYAAFSSAISALPTAGGRITVPSGTWKLLTQPTWGAKSIQWDIAPDAVFTGAGTGEGKFPYAVTNVALLPVGPFIQSQSSQKSTNSNGAVAALTVEMLQPVGYGAGQSVAIYSAARSANTNVAGNVWAANLLVRADSGAGGNFYGDEIDVDCYSGSATMVGLLLSGTGDHNPTAAIITDRLLGQWQTGINIRKALDGLVIFGETGGRGAVIDAPGSVLVTPISNTAISARQFANAADTVLLQRFTDTTPTGYFIRFRNAADNANLYSVDVAGNVAANSVAIGGGTPVTKTVVYTPSITPSSVAAATVAEQTFTVTGLTTADKVIVNPPTVANATGIAGARVSAADTLAIRFVNPTAGALTPSSGTYTVLALRS